MLSKRLEYYKSLKEFSPPDAPNYYWAETLDAYKAGKVAMAMDYFAFFPGAVNADQNPNYYNKTGFFISPAGPKGHAISIGGQGMSISAYSKNQEIAKRYMKWFMQKPVQEKWAQLGGFTPHKEVLQSEVFLNATPFNKAFAASFPYLARLLGGSRIRRTSGSVPDGLEPSCHRIQISQRGVG